MDDATLAAWNEQIAILSAALAASSGLNRMQIEAQIEDAKKGRDNQMKIAQLQAETSRYGTDAQTAATLATLKQRAHEFELTHALDVQKVGLQRAQTATDYLSTPDRFIQAADYLNMSSRVLAGQGGPSPYGSTGTPTPKTEGDFAVLEQGGIPGASGGAAAAGAAAGGTGGDARQKALAAIHKAYTPSNGLGMNENDLAVLDSTAAILKLGLAPGQYEAMRPGQQAIFGSAAKRLGYDPKDWLADRAASLPGQGSARAY